MVIYSKIPGARRASEEFRKYYIVEFFPRLRVGLKIMDSLACASGSG
jgi:hypothetical protein